ncbi:GAF and ANTAR domain-containing protein [Mycobacterium cookii]|uniref:Transcriptional regulator n=2 Tax=Mycobacterium cookii TaxID=1775 RepID=A0A7I7L526_9MYCO|nr:transcriptional regulator [Mycobacterium cookii]
MNSQTAMFLKATHLVAELHQRASFDTPALLRDLIEGAAKSVPGAQYAGITVTQKRRRSQTAAATHRYPVMLDEIQSRCQQGPCLTAAALQNSVLIDNLDTDERWPLYREEALKQTPIRSILSYGMFKDGGTTAALNFYAEPVNAFDDGSVDLGLIFATHTALVWNMMRRDQQFRSAIISRDIIGQAKGRLMERFDIDADEAFEMLRQMSQGSNTQIIHIAQRIVSDERPTAAKDPS